MKADGVTDAPLHRRAHSPASPRLREELLISQRKVSHSGTVLPPGGRADPRSTSSRLAKMPILRGSHPGRRPHRPATQREYLVSPAPLSAGRVLLARGSRHRGAPPGRPAGLPGRGGRAGDPGRGAERARAVCLCPQPDRSRTRRRNRWILTGSKEAPLMPGVTESMAGRSPRCATSPRSVAFSPWWRPGTGNSSIEARSRPRWG